MKTGPITLPIIGAVPTSVLDAAVNPMLDTIMSLIRTELHLIDPLVQKVNDIVGPLATGWASPSPEPTSSVCPRPCARRRSCAARRAAMRHLGTGSPITGSPSRRTAGPPSGLSGVVTND